MAYQKKYEDTYLDKDDEEFTGDDKTDAERIVALLEKPSRSPKEEVLVQQLTERLFVAAQLPGTPGEQAVFGLELVANAYKDLGLVDTATALWAQLSDVAGVIGNKELYYKAMDAITELGEAVYEEHHPNG